ncbi:DUF413 domain-containing protein [Thalassotalea marina]|uniref:Macrodomain Ori protein n=1 Tax=Thalassotalea marina TaxID=1673741 RepID=A0A919BQ63_9GAMM|nr:DUF413 domain-containing protein [Thalassotalea marina]GHG04246.1 hypothetical protein GCM10017161_37180 [Thalassotalea marina]
MNLAHGFVKTSAFYDDSNFPRGFRKCGSFTIKEAELLSSIGKRLQLLAAGKALPETDVEKDFITVCTGVKAPESHAEKLWLKYTSLTKKRSFHTLSGGTKVNAGDVDVDAYETEY